jgi:hypothetical protein
LTDLYLRSYDNVGGELLDLALVNMKVDGNIGKLALSFTVVPLSRTDVSLKSQAV